MTTYALDALMTYARGGYNSAGGDAANYLKKQFPKELQAQHLYSVYTLAKFNMMPIDKINLSEIDVLKLNTTEKIYFYKLKQLKGESIKSNEWYQLLLEITNNVHLKHYGNFFHDHKANVFNAYNIFKGTSIEGEMKAKFRQDIITGNLSRDLNTFSKAAMIEALVQDEYLENTINSQLVINDQIKVNNYPYRMKIDMISKLKIQHSGAPIWMTTSEEEFISNPAMHDSVFRVETQFIQNAQATTTLTRGLPTQLRVDIYAFQSKDYVMIEIPLPAGVIIKDKKMYFGRDYIEYKSDKILIFKNKISIGENTLTFDIQPIYAGKFNLPPAQISMMYYPHIYGNNLKKEIIIR
jgi:alpha-2-macroglobulin